MSRTYRLLLSILFLSLPFPLVKGQTFTATPPFHELIYEQDQFVFYAYSTLTNLTGADLNMGWRKSFPRPYPSAWENTVEVPDTFYTQGEVSGTFVLESAPVIPEKVICQFYPNHTIATASVIIRVFNLADTTEFVDVEWVAKTTATTTSLSPRVTGKALDILPNPARDEAWLDMPQAYVGGQFEVLDSRGKHFLRIAITRPGQMQVATREWPAGVYWILATDAHGNPRQTGKLVVVK